MDLPRWTLAWMKLLPKDLLQTRQAIHDTEDHMPCNKAVGLKVLDKLPLRSLLTPYGHFAAPEPSYGSEQWPLQQAPAPQNPQCAS